MKRIIVGDNKEYLAHFARSIDQDAFLITKHNYKKIAEISKSTGYVSMADLPKITDTNPLYDCLIQADEIIYAPPSDKWTDETGDFQWMTQKYITEFLLFQMHELGKTVKNFDLTAYQTSPYLELNGQRHKQSKSNIWIAGGSDSHGIGIDEKQRYGDIIARQLQSPVTYLTRPGTGIEYAADQILRSDICQTDIVIWGLTPECRSTYAHNGKIKSITSDSKESVEYLTSETLFYKSLVSIFQVINFTKKIHCKLILLPICSSAILHLHLIHTDSYCKIPFNKERPYIDYGSDGTHPGPKQHQMYADLCLDMLNGPDT
jgi:hypothetical protein